MFDRNNKVHLQLLLELWQARANAFWQSTVFNNGVTRYENNRACYYRKSTVKEPIWKSKLFFPVFFVACQGFEAQLKALIQTPMAEVTYKTLTAGDQGKADKEKILNFDLDNDLYVSNFNRTLMQMYWFNKIFGVSFARESFLSEAVVKNRKEVVSDAYGNESIVENSNIQLKERGRTEAIHPLNFWQTVNKGEVTDCTSCGCRYEMTLAQLYAMLDDPDCIKEDVNHIISEIAKGQNGWTPGARTFYVDDPTRISESKMINTIIVEECSGDANFKDNYSDNQLYFGIYSRQFNKWLRVGKNPYRRHPYWKMRTYPDPFSPYGVGACDAVIPLNLFKNMFFNQYADWSNANLKFMYEVFPENVVGGLAAIIQGQPGGMLQAIDEQAFRNGNLVRPVEKNNTGIPGVSDILNYIEKHEISASPSNNMKNDVKGGNDLATKVLEIAKKEDNLIASIVADMDCGLIDGLQQKIQNRIDFVRGEQTGKLDKNSPCVRYFPFELSEDGINIEIRRTSPTQEANKYLTFLSKVGEAMAQFGFQPYPENIMRLYARVGRQVGIDADELMSVKMVPPQIMGGGSMPKSGPSDAVQTPEIQPAKTQGQGVTSAMALA